MRYNPRYSAVISSPLTPDMVSSTLREHTSPKYPGFMGISPGGWDFFGHVGTDRFTISPVIPYRRLSCSKVYGAIKPCEGGSRVALEIQLEPYKEVVSFFVLVICSLSVLFGGWRIFSRDMTAWPLLLFGLFFLAVERFMVRILFSREAKKVHQRLRKLLFALPAHE